MRGKQCVRAIIFNKDSVLTMKRNKFGMEYYTLIGGGVEMGEDLELALRREIREETGLDVGAAQYVFIEDAGDMYGVQHVFWCEYKGGEPSLSQEAPELAITAMGQNTYVPTWLPVSELPNVPFRSNSLRSAILDSLRDGFPKEPRELAFKA